MPYTLGRPKMNKDNDLSKGTPPLQLPTRTRLAGMLNELVQHAQDACQVHTSKDDIRALNATRDEFKATLDTIYARLNALEAALQPFAEFQRQWNRQPMRGLDHTVYAIHTGTEYAAELTRTHLQSALELLRGPEGENRAP